MVKSSENIDIKICAVRQNANVKDRATADRKRRRIEGRVDGEEGNSRMSVK